MDKLDDRLPDDIFSGKGDLYRLLRETRSTVNSLMFRIEALELLNGNNNIVDEGDMANTSGNSGMVPNSVGKKRGRPRK